MGLNLNLGALLKNPAALAVGLSAAGGVFGNKAEKQEQTSSTNLTPEQQALLKQLIDQQTKLSAGTDLTGYEAGQTSDINHASDLHLQNVRDNLALRGITGDAAAAAEQGVDSQRFSDITKLHQSVPLLQNQLQTQALSSGLNLFSSMPRNTVSTGTTSGNKLGGGLSNAAATLAYFLGQGAFKPPKPASTNTNSPVPSSTFNPGVFMPPNYRTPNYVE